MTSIVFSRDRPLQLDAFLRSYAQWVPSGDGIDVLYRASSPRYADAYRQVFARHGWVRPHGQEVFKPQVIDLISESLVIFFCDDMVFLRPWSVTEARPGLSLRLAPHLTSNYASGSSVQPLPPFEPAGDDRLSWTWGDGTLAWGYPLSVDGHVFDAAELREMAAAVDFDSPNTFEAALQRYLGRFTLRRGICYDTAKVVNIPWNRVQTDYDNRHESAVSPDELLRAWEAHQQLDLSRIYGACPLSVHHPFPLILEERTWQFTV